MDPIGADGAPRAEYARRMQRVLAHIEAHLAAPLELKALAEVAHFSPFHFHRVFAGWMGETLGDYLRRRRLETAAALLRRQPQTAVLTIALDVGFGSGEAFARAFKAHYGRSPGVWRRLRNLDQGCRNPDQDDAAAAAEDAKAFLANFHKEPTVTMNVQVMDLPAVRVASLRYTGPYGAPVGEFWAHQVVPWARALGLRPSSRYGISYDDPSVTPPSQCRYDAAFELPADLVVPAGVTVQQLPGGPYAVARYEGTSSEIGPAWRWLMGEWLPASGYDMDDRPCFERQGPGDVGGGPGLPFSCDICIPLRPL